MPAQQSMNRNLILEITAGLLLTKCHQSLSQKLKKEEWQLWMVFIHRPMLESSTKTYT